LASRVRRLRPGDRGPAGGALHARQRLSRDQGRRAGGAGRRCSYPATYAAGVYNRLPTTIAGRTLEDESIVNLPNWLPLTFRTEDGCGLEAAEFLEHRVELDLRRGVLTRLGEVLESAAKPVDVGAAPGEELAAEAQVETRPADDVGHERVAGDEAAARQSNRERTEVEPVARAAPPLGEVTVEDRLETPLAVALEGTALVREHQTCGELAEQREQRQVRPRGRLEPMRFRLRDGDRPASDGGPQDRLELAEGDLPLHDAAQVVLIEVEELHRPRIMRSTACL
jgi:Glycosyl hydrolase family 65, N-terminal domain